MQTEVGEVRFEMAGKGPNLRLIARYPFPAWPMIFVMIGYHPLISLQGGKVRLFIKTCCDFAVGS